MRRSEPQYPSPTRNRLLGGSATAGDRIEGWLFDIDELGPWVTLWVYDDDGRLRRLTDEFHPPVYAHGDRAKLKQLAADMSKRELIAGLRWVQKREFWSGDEIEVLQLNVSDSSHLSKLREIAAKLDRDITFYNLDIPTPQHYLYLAKLFPLCRVKGRVDERGAVIEIAATNSAWELDHPMPPLRVMRMRGERMRPLTAASRLIIATENTAISSTNRRAIRSSAAGTSTAKAHSRITKRGWKDCWRCQGSRGCPCKERPAGRRELL